MSHHLKLRGVRSEVWTIDQDYLDYPVDKVLTTGREPVIVQMFKALRAGQYLFGRWDVVHFNYGSTLFSNGGKLLSRRGADARRNFVGLLTGALRAISAVLQRTELSILRARRIPFFVHYQGDDARQGDYSLEHFDVSIATQVPFDYYSPESDDWKRKQIALMSKHAASIYAVNPDLLNVLPSRAEFIPYGHVPIRDWEPVYPQQKARRLVFAHAPSNRMVKGTDLILEALTELKSEGYDFDLDLIEGVSNVDALSRYRNADILIDQLYAGWYGGVAVEAMALGKPVVVYLRESDLRFIPKAMASEMPFFRTSPTTIAATLRHILELQRSELISRAKASRAFVERWHDPDTIAARILGDYRVALESTTRKSDA